MTLNNNNNIFYYGIKWYYDIFTMVLNNCNKFLLIIIIFFTKTESYECKTYIKFIHFEAIDPLRTLKIPKYCTRANWAT